MSGGLRLALPGGALFEDACRLLSDAGVADIDAGRFDRQLKIATPTATVVKVRPTDVPVYVEMGACDAGIVGKDILWESPRDCYELVDLRFGACRLVLAAPQGSPLAEGRFPQSLRAATKYPIAARRFFDSLGLAAVSYTHLAPVSSASPSTSNGWGSPCSPLKRRRKRPRPIGRRGCQTAPGCPCSGAPP